jgi:glycosyltransferase involved in cell wall biosynthesis
MKPRVSIGIPVYNGELYIRQAIESVLAQTFRDLELIVSDNASTDSTAEIMREYAARDPRVRYSRNRVNIGAARNYKVCLELATGEYFRWLAADDFIAPALIQRGIETLDANPQAVLAYSPSQAVDEAGRALPMRSGGSIDYASQADVATRYRLFREERDLRHGHRAWPMLYIFGLMRTADLQSTSQMPSFINSDSTVVLEMLLRGRFAAIPETLTFFRHHAGSYSISAKDNKKRRAFFDASVGLVSRLLGDRQVHIENALAVLRAPTAVGAKRSILQHMVTWALWGKRHAMSLETAPAPVVGPSASQQT